MATPECSVISKLLYWSQNFSVLGGTEIHVWETFTIIIIIVVLLVVASTVCSVLLVCAVTGVGVCVAVGTCISAALNSKTMSISIGTSFSSENSVS